MPKGGARPCPAGCTCKRHSRKVAPCSEGCGCRKHIFSEEHRKNIGKASAKRWKEDIGFIEKQRESWTPERRLAQANAFEGYEATKEVIARRSLAIRKGAGSRINNGGYVVLKGQYEHPLASSSYEILEHRKVLYDKIGPGPHPCNWGCGEVLDWGGRDGIQADHLNGNRLDNSQDNLVPSCFGCNTRRRHAGNPIDWSGA